MYVCITWSAGGGRGGQEEVAGEGGGQQEACACSMCITETHSADTGTTRRAGQAHISLQCTASLTAAAL